VPLLRELEEVEEERAVFSKILWVPLQLCEGAEGFQGTAVVQKVSTVLAENEISIFFVSTFSEDYALIGSEDLQKALAVLGTSFSLIADTPSEDVLDSLKIRSPLSTPPRSRESTIFQELGNEEQGYPAKTVLLGPQIKQGPKQAHPLSVPPIHLRVCKLSREYIVNRAAAIIQMFFFPEESVSRFLSYTETENEITLVAPEEYLEQLQFEPSGHVAKVSDFMIGRITWRPIQIGCQPLGLIETGIVSAFTEAISRAQTDIFYISTFMSDFGMVPSEQLDLAVDTLKEKYEVHEDFITETEINGETETLLLNDI